MLICCYGEASYRLETVTAVMHDGRGQAMGVAAVGRIAHLTNKRQYVGALHNPRPTSGLSASLLQRCVPSRFSGSAVSRMRNSRVVRSSYSSLSDHIGHTAIGER